MESHGRLELALVFTLGFFCAIASLYAVQALHRPIMQTQYCAASVQAIFSPGSQGDFESFALSAERTLDAMLYQFSNPGMMETLAQAAGKGVKVRVLLEPRVESNYATAEFLANKGVQVRFASKEYTNTHSKTAVVDGRKVLVGSTNWSRQAMRSNRESSVVVESVSLAQEFEKVFEGDWTKAKDFVPSTAG
ncbi:MAG: phospholipase D-like domain-containing protein [Candidatus Norongarragalinales archaeon]